MKRALTTWPEALVQRFGEHAIMLALVVSQIIANLGVIPAIYFVQINAEIDPPRFWKAALFLSLTLVVGYLLLWVTVLRLTTHARHQLRSLKNGLSTSGSSNEAKAWEEITALGWRYAIATGLVMLFVNIVPLLIYESVVLRLTFEQVIYTLIAASIVAAGGLILNVALFEGFLTPVRMVLTPKSFETQLTYFRGLSLTLRLIAATLTLIAISVALT
ncbi:MAG: hypothetical protein ACK8QZ_06345, partial [Anaerolineales bacterium]